MYLLYCCHVIILCYRLPPTGSLVGGLRAEAVLLLAWADGCHNK